MGVSIISTSHFETTKWSGGTTKELFIYPNNSSYQKRDFGFRLSTASVEISTSTFTPLPGFHRELLLLSGQMKLTFNGEHVQELGKFDVASFEGEWETQSEGTCTDFNLMMNDDFDGEVLGVELAKSELVHIDVDNETHWLFVYNLKNPLTVILGNKNYSVGTNELLVIDEVDFDVLSLHSDEAAECVVVSITELES